MMSACENMTIFHISLIDIIRESKGPTHLLFQFKIGRHGPLKCRALEGQSLKQLNLGHQ